MAGTPTPDAHPSQRAMGVYVVDAATSEPSHLRCCCGRDECVFLKHNCSVLSSVERDVQTAARMGQALLARHEAYMASTERDRRELTAHIEQLEHDNAELEAKNKAVTDENDALQQDLDQANDTIKDAEAKIERLEAALLNSQREVRRLEKAEARADSLERHVAHLEEEQVKLRTTIVRTEEEARTIMNRWRETQTELGALQQQIDAIEEEAKKERERHVETVARMERQREMEKELYTAAGRLKGAASVKSMTERRHSGDVVFQLVRDLMQDNTVFQLNIAELCDSLRNANDEIQMLRDQLMYQQPAAGQETTLQTLQAELEKKEPPTPPVPQVQQQLHILHHYHVTHKPDTRKPRRKRLTPGIFTPPALSAPGSPVVSSARWPRRALAVPPLSTVNSPLASSDPRWSLQTEGQELETSSAPSSPRSTNRDSIFDRVPDLPSPTSPTTSVDPASPGWKTAHRKRISELSLRSISETAMFSPETSRPPSRFTPCPNPLSRFAAKGHPSTALTSAYTTDDMPIATASLAGYLEPHVEDTPSPTADLFDPSLEQNTRRGSLRRVVSHESIMSLSNGLDIHTLTARPSQLTLRPLGLTAAGTNLSAVTAQPTLSSASGAGKRGSVILRDSIAQGLGRSPIPPRPKGKGMRVVSSPVRGRGRDRTRGEEGRGESNRAPSALGKLVAWRPWGGNSNNESNDTTRGDVTASPETSPSSTPILNPSATTSAPTSIPTLARSSTLTSSTTATAATNFSKSPQGSCSSASTSTATTRTATVPVTATASLASTPIFRAPGINQPGVIPGFQEYFAAHKRRVVPTKVAVEGGERERVGEALREVLEEL
ncbi:hypothetical protein VTI74DRAFT_6586 [Chaetomium olivicolor]